MTIISGEMLADMQSRRQRRESYADIAKAYGIKERTVYMRLYRDGSTFEEKPEAGPDNSKNPNRITKTSYRNGGCSTLSGPMPVTMPRLACLGEKPMANMGCAA